jgi:alpha-L-rhamnosidase
VVGDLRWVRASCRSVRGTIESAWSRRGDLLTLDVTIPPNTTATVYVPTDRPSSVREGKGPAAASPGIHALSAKPRVAVFRVGSGMYRFTSTLAAGRQTMP